MLPIADWLQRLDCRTISNGTGVEVPDGLAFNMATQS